MNLDKVQAMGRIQKVAYDLWDRCVNGERPTGREIKTDYNLSEPQFLKVKKYVTRLAEEKGVVWGYYPPTNRYVIADPGKADYNSVWREVIAYSAIHGRDATQKVASQMRAAFMSGLVSAQDSAYVTQLASATEGPLTDIANRLLPPHDESA